MTDDYQIIHLTGGGQEDTATPVVQLIYSYRWVLYVVGMEEIFPRASPPHTFHSFHSYRLYMLVVEKSGPVS